MIFLSVVFPDDPHFYFKIFAFLFSSFSSDILLQWENQAIRDADSFNFPTLNSIKVCASESPCFFFSSFHNGVRWPLHLLGWISLQPPSQEPALQSSPYLYIYAASHWLLYIRPQTGSGLNQTFLNPPFTAYVPPTSFIKRLIP